MRVSRESQRNREDFVQDAHALAALLRAAGQPPVVRFSRGLPVWLVTGYAEARMLLADPRLSKDIMRGRRLFQEKMGQNGDPGQTSQSSATPALDTEVAGDPLPDILSNRGFAGRLVAQLLGYDPRSGGGTTGAGSPASRRADEGAAGQSTLALISHMLNSDPPDHTRLRRLVNKAFTARTVAGLRLRIEAIAAQLLDQLAGVEETDLMRSFAAPLPIMVICELLGVHDIDRHRFTGWSNTFNSAASAKEIQESAEHIHGYLSRLIDEKRSDPADDLLSGLVHVSDNGDALSAEELLAMASLLLVAGHETTVNLIGNGVLALLRNPAQLRMLRKDPALLPQAVEEFLRYDGPLHLATMRFTTEAVQAGETEIPAGEFVLISLLGANRDPQRFTEPDRLDITRTPGGHLAFGHGIHFCVGAPLARLEAEIAIGALLARFGDLELAAEPEALRWRPSMLMHGLATLPVRLHPAL